MISMTMSGTDLLEVPTIYFWPIFEAYVREYPHEIWSYMVQYLHFRILKFQLMIPEILFKETIINQLISSLKNSSRLVLVTESPPPRSHRGMVGEGMATPTGFF